MNQLCTIVADSRVQMSTMKQVAQTKLKKDDWLANVIYLKLSSQK